MPEFPGGENKMLEFVYSNFNYPAEIDACCSVTVEFIIDKEGNMTELKIKNGLQEDFDNEMLRVFKLMPKWSPGMQKGEPLPVKLIYPIRIDLQ